MLSNFGPATADVRFTVRRLEGGLAVVDLDPAVRQGFAFVSPMDAVQLTSALGQFGWIDRVAILVGGEPLCRVPGAC